uniref:Uncharacterized protein orf105 n=2 Tax=Pavlovaceae TaxID=418969 RepID=E9P6B1_DIALT|nr:hypothetical protein [Diacronema lutheri]QHD45369.1 hypothetical protein [Pavlova sp. NIVA-4/92]
MTFWYKFAENTGIIEKEENAKEHVEKKRKVDFLPKTRAQDKGSPFFKESSLEDTDDKQIFGNPDKGSILKIFAIDKILDRDVVLKAVKDDFSIRYKAKGFLGFKR